MGRQRLTSPRGCWFVVGLLAATTPCPARAQYCVGSTRYSVRDATGKEMALPQLQRLEVLQINGAEARKVTVEKAQAIYEAVPDPKRTPYRIAVTNPLLLGGMNHCGSIGEITLRYEGRTMRLRFGLGEHNAAYLIESLPFQPGDFSLAGYAEWTLPCASGHPPPLIDNENNGTCRVSSKLWHPTRGAVAAPDELQGGAGGAGAR